MTTPELPTPKTEAEALINFVALTFFTNFKLAREYEATHIGAADSIIALYATVALIERDFDVCMCDNCIAGRLEKAQAATTYIGIFNTDDEAGEGIERGGLN